MTYFQFDWIIKICVAPVIPVISDDKVLAVGGMATDTNPQDYFRSIDIEENKWKALPPLPTPRYATFSFLINEKLYVIGKCFCVNPLPHMPIFGSSNSVTNKIMMSKILTNVDTIF